MGHHISLNNASCHIHIYVTVSSYLQLKRYAL